MPGCYSHMLIYTNAKYQLTKTDHIYITILLHSLKEALSFYKLNVHKIIIKN